MAITAMMGLMDDAARPVFRLFGKAGPPKPKMIFDPKNPMRLIHAARSGDTMALETMRKMHYGPFYGTAGRMTGMNRLAERELLTKGKGFSGALFGRPIKGLGVGLGHMKGIGIFAGIAGAAEGAMAERGHKMSGVAGGVARTLAFAVGDVVGSALGGPIAGFLLGSLTEGAGAAVGQAVQMFHDFNYNIRHINMGGNYKDSQMALTMRQRAAIEMGSSVMNARTWLGKESVLMHQ